MFEDFVNFPAEQEVLKCLIFGNVNEVATFSSESFCLSEHKEIFNTIKILKSTNEKVNLATIFPHISENARVVLTNLQLDYLNDDCFEASKNQVLDFEIRRKIADFSDDLKKKSFDFSQSSSSLIACIRDFETCVEGKGTSAFANFVPDMVTDFYEKLENRGSVGGNPGLSFGYKELDKYTGGLIGGYLYVIAGRPAMGKSALASSIAVNVANKQKNVAYFSLEMSNNLCMQRFASFLLLIKNSALKVGSLTPAEWDYLAGTGLSKLSKIPIYIFDNSLVSSDIITDDCLKLNARLNGKLDLVIVDYLQIMVGQGNDRRQVVEDNCRKLKILAKRLNVPVIMLSQLNRENTMQADKRPSLNQLRETGAIEQDADTVLFIHRQSYYNKTEDNDAEIIIAKQRDGALGTVHLHFDPEHTAFRELNFIAEEHKKRGYEQCALEN